MRIYANADSWEDGFGADWYSELSLKPIFKNTLYYDVEGDIFDAGAGEKWGVYSGKDIEAYGWLINGKFYSEDDDDYPEGFDKDNDDMNDYGPRVIKYCTYKEGELINIEYIEEEW